MTFSRPSLFFSSRFAVVFLLALAVSVTRAESPSPAPASALDLWRKAYAAGTPTAMPALFAPGGKVGTSAGDIPATQDAQFWLSLRQSGHTNVNFEDVSSTTPAPHQMQLITRISLTGASTKVAPSYVNIGMLWESDGTQWHLKYARRTDASRLRQPLETSKDIYHAGHDAHADIQSALQHAALEGKNVIVVFGANWCYDCHVLDLAFEKGDVAELVRNNYEVVHVDVGQGDKNQDLMQQYGVPMARGIPAVAVLNGKGTLLVSQRSGEFEAARSLGPEDLEAFLNKWKPRK